MPLPANWIDQLFTKLAVPYRTAWTMKWEGIDLDAVRADWAEELGGLHSSDGARMIQYALRYLPERPPTVQEFRAQCNRCPPRPAVALPAPKADPAAAAAVRAKVHEIFDAKRDPLAGAKAMRDREAAGDHLSQQQRDYWRAALAMHLPSGPEIGAFNPVPADALPPGLRPGAPPQVEKHPVWNRGRP
jgi:hypothetical protein